MTSFKSRWLVWSSTATATTNNAAHQKNLWPSTVERPCQPLTSRAMMPIAYSGYHSATLVINGMRISNTGFENP